MQWEKEIPQQVYLRQPVGKTWKTYTFAQAGREIRAIAAALQALGLPKGSHVALVSKNCAQWPMADLAIWMAGYVAVPLYANLTAKGFSDLLAHSESKALFIGKMDTYAEIDKARPANLPAIHFPFRRVSERAGLDLHWDDVVARTPSLQEVQLPSPSDIATIIYTSGTTGDPKGAMHDFASLAVSGSQLVEIFEFRRFDRFFAYLTFAHVAEKLICEIASLYCAGNISFVESLASFQGNLADVQPHIFLAVPRIWTKFQEGVLAKLSQEKLSRLLALPIVGALVRRKIRTALGLRDMHTGVSGAAPIPEATLRWYAALGIRIQEAYGMTENFAYSHGNRRSRIKVGTVGQPQNYVEAKIVEGGELWVASPANMRGYFKNPEATKATLEGDYVKTGDQGEIDAQGYLKLTGRVKDLFKTAKGKYVTPAPIELALGGLSYIAQVCVVGSGLAQPLALIVLSEEAALPDRARVSQALEEIMKKTNEDLESYERLAKIVVVAEHWTVENNLLTPSLKIKRSAIDSRYGAHYETWQKKTEPVVWDQGSVKSNT